MIFYSSSWLSDVRIQEQNFVLDNITLSQHVCAKPNKYCLFWQKAFFTFYSLRVINYNFVTKKLSTRYIAKYYVSISNIVNSTQYKKLLAGAHFKNIYIVLLEIMPLKALTGIKQATWYIPSLHFFGKWLRDKRKC